MSIAKLPVLVLGSAWLGFALAACSEGSKPEPEPGPPPFSGVDPSLTCPSGQIGWDFTTGGGINGEAFFSEPVRGVRIVKAWYGHNCGNAKGFDRTDEVGRTCNSKDECEWHVVTPQDVAPGCHKEALVEWKCGVESPTYSLSAPGEAGGQRLKPTCGGKIEIVTATYGHNCGIALGTHTAKMTALCGGARRCTYRPVDAFGDPAVGCGKRIRVQYRCGSENQILTHETGEELTTFSCPVLPAANSPTIKVVATTYGQNCSNGISAQEAAAQLAKVGPLCNGKVACSVLAGLATFGNDPKPNCAKDLEIAYQCGSGAATYRVKAKENEQAVVTCVTEESLALSGIRIVSASYGENCRAENAGNNTDNANNGCYGRDRCGLGPVAKGDPAPGCPKAYTVKFRCGSEATTYSATIPGEAGGKTTEISCAAPIYVRSATYGANCNAANTEGNSTVSLKGVCENKRGICDYSIGLHYDPAGGCSKDFTAAYTCGLDPTVRTVTRAREAGGQVARLECPVLPPPPTLKARKECVPATCTGRTRRDADLRCASAPNMLDLTTFALQSIAIAPGGEQTNFDGKLYADSAYNITGTFTHVGAPVNARLALWATDVFRHKTNGQMVEGFACVLTNVNIKSDGKAGSKTTPLFSNVVSGECFAQKSTWGDAANRVSLSEPAFRDAYTYVGNKLRASLDATGDFYVRDVRPNPPGFFYKPAITWVDMIAYYAQTEVTGFTSTPFVFDANPRTIEIGLASAKLNTAAVALELFGRQEDPSVDVDFTWYASGQHVLNPYSVIEGSPTLGAVPRGQNLADRKLRGEVEIYPTGSPGQIMALTSTDGISVRKAVATGTTESARLKLPREVIEKMFDDWKGYSTFGVRVCLRANGLAKTAGKQCLPGISVNSQSWNACTGPNLTCKDAGTLMVTSRDAIKRPLEYQRATASVANTNTATSGDSRAKGNAMSGQQNECTNNGTTDKCLAVRASDNQNEGAFGSTYFASNQEAERSETNGTAKASVDMTAELKGYQVLDMADSDQEESNNWTPTLGWQKPTIKITITPPWDLIIGSAKLSEKFAAAPVKPKVERGRYANESGMGIGIGVEGAIPFGPIPGTMSASATAGVSLTLEFSVKFVPETAYPCVGDRGSKCFQLDGARKSHTDAARACAARGGRLAEMATSADQAAITAAAGDSDWAWLGGQTSFEFPAGRCSRPDHRNDGFCKNNAVVWYRWIGSDRVFGYIDPKNGAGYYYSNNVPTGNIHFTRVLPETLGIAFKKGTYLEDFFQTDGRPFICEFDAARKTLYQGYEVRLKLGAGAGLNASICSPSSSLGICLAANFNFVDASISPGITYDHFFLFDQRNSPIGTRGNTRVDVPWELRVLTGSVDAVMNFLFFNVSWNVASFSGYKVAGGNLWQYDWPSRKDF